MADFTIDVSSSKTSRINLGIQGENIVENIIFNISEWITDFGQGVAYIYATRHGDTEPYPIALEMDMDAGTATWNVSAVDTAYKGKGRAQLVYIVDEDNDNDYEEDEIKKTKIYATTVQASIVSSSDENPDAYETWLEVLGGYTSRIEAANIAAQQAKAAAIEAQEAAEAAQTAAETAQGNSEDSAEDSEAYAKGTRGGTDVSSDDPAYHANSYYYSQLAYNSAVDAIAAEGNSESSAETSEAYAVGKRGGSDVSSGDPAYNNNSKYYAGKASDSATAAAGSASAADDSAEDSEAYAVGKRDGVDVGNTDPTYHNNSKYYAGEAASSAGDASDSALAASGSASAADDSAEDSEAYATGKRDGTDVSSDDPAYHNNSKYFKDQTDAAATQAITDIGTAKVNAVADVNSAKDTAVGAVNSAKDTAVAAVNTAAAAFTSVGLSVVDGKLCLTFEE